MPADSFKLIFDGDPAPDQSSQVFDVIKETTTWRIALDQWLRHNTTDDDSKRQKLIIYYAFEDFAQVVKSIVNGNSFIGCNFNIGDIPDIQALLDMSRDWTLNQWTSESRRILARVRNYPSPPLPPWRDLRLKQVLPEGEE